MTTGQLVRISFPKILHRGQLQKLIHPLFDLLFALFLDLQSKRNILLHSHITKQRIILKYEADPPPASRNLIDPFPLYQNISVIRTVQSGDHAENRCLTASTRTEQSRQMTFFYAEGHIS